VTLTPRRTNASIGSSCAFTVTGNVDAMLLNVCCEGGLSEAQLDAVERRLRAPLPNDYRCSCRLHSGQENVTTRGPGYSANIDRAVLIFTARRYA